MTQDGLSAESSWRQQRTLATGPESAISNDDREVRISFSKWRPVQGQATVGSFNAHGSGNRLRSIAVRNKKPHSPCVIADYPNLTDCHFGVRRDRLSQKRLSDPSPNPSFVRVARDSPGARPLLRKPAPSASAQGECFAHRDPEGLSRCGDGCRRCGRL